MKKECNCQYEKGHSFECPLYEELKNTMEDWREELKRQFYQPTIDKKEKLENIIIRWWRCQGNILGLKGYIAKKLLKSALKDY